MNYFQSWVISLMFFGVENLIIRDVIISNHRTFAALIANWRNVDIRNIEMTYSDGGYMSYQNQDGFHFWGPGQCLTIRDVRGSSGDDFIALAPDENDLESSIQDVLIDNVVLINADAGIRLLSRGNGRLDRVTIRNVSGTYKSFGFFINPYYPGNQGGNFGSLLFDNINLHHTRPNYDYTTPFLFRISGKIDNLSLINILHLEPEDGRPIIEIGSVKWSEDDKQDDYTRVSSLSIDGMKITDLNGNANKTEFIILKGHINRFSLMNTEVIQQSGVGSDSCLICVKNSSVIETMMIHDAYVKGLKNIIRFEGGDTKTMQIHHVLYEDLTDQAIKYTGTEPYNTFIDNIQEIMK